MRTSGTFPITLRAAVGKQGLLLLLGPEGPLDNMKGLLIKEEFGSKELGGPVPSAVVRVAEAGGGW